MSQHTSSANPTPADSDHVADALRERIRTGELRPGDSLPTQKSLMDEFGVQRGTVRQALAQLKREDLLTDVTKGSPPTVAEAQETREEAPRAGGVELAERLRLAFQAKHVTLDVFSLTTETLNQAIAPTLLEIAAETLQPPESITVRLIVPAPDSHLPIPQLVGDPKDPRPLRRLHRLVELQARTFQFSLQSLQDRGLVDNVTLEVKGIALTPTHKLYVLNGDEALFGLYKVVEQHVDQPEHMHIYDVLGLDVSLSHYSNDASGSPQDRALFEQLQEWFESLWNTIARPLTLAV